MKTIGILIERQRMYGRRLCEGIIRFARERTDWSLKIVDFADLQHPARLSSCDGFIARVMDDRAEATLTRAVELNAASPRARAEAYVAMARNAEGKGDVATAVKYATVVTSLFSDAELCAEAKKILDAHPEAAQ